MKQVWKYFLGGLTLLTLVACSLAEDITPPPGYQNSTVVPALTEASLTPQATAAFTSATGSIASAPTEAASPVGSSAGITFKGRVINASTGLPAASPITAYLYLYNSSTSTIDQSLTAQVNHDGDYLFENVPADSKTTYFVMLDYGGITYASDPVSYDGSFTTRDVPITIYDATEDLNQLSISQVHLQFDFSTTGQAQARFLYIFNNPGKKSVLVQSDGRNIPFIQIPTGATNTQFELAQGGAALAKADNGFALLPGANKQYGIIASFSLPYTKSLTLSQSFSLPVSSETVLIPVGMKIQSDQLVDTGIQNVDGTNYHIYQGSALASGSSLSLKISGTPGASGQSTSAQQTTILIILLTAGILLVGLGIFLLRRNRPGMQPATVSDENLNQATSDEDPDSIMDAIIALDDQYKGGCISRSAYTKRREDLKNKLKELI